MEKFGFRKATIGAFVGHIAGVTHFLAAYPFAGDPFAYWILFLGAIGFGAGNGLIEVAGNPMVAALFPKNKTTKLNHFHAFFPGGMVVGRNPGMANDPGRSHWPGKYWSLDTTDHDYCL